MSIGIGTLSDLGSEDLATGPHGRAYDLQLKLGYAQERLSSLREQLHYELSRQRGISLTSPFETVEHHADVIAARNQVEELRQAVNEAQASLGGIVFLPAVENLPEIEKRLSALNKKSTKLGTEPISLKVSDEKLYLNYKIDNESTRGYDFEHVFVVLTGTTPKIPGFEFLATVTHTDEGNVIKRIPAIAYGVRHNMEFGNDDRENTVAKRALEAIDLSKYRSTGNLCEQCGLHRERLDTFIVYNEETGETKQVGRNCLRDYTGLNNPERVLKVLEQVWEFMRSMGARGEKPSIPTKSFLTHCAALMRKDGGYKKGLGYDAAENIWLRANDKRDRQNLPLWVEPIEADEAHAELILNWVKEWDETSEFAHNVKISLAGSHMNAKLYGIGGAALVAYEKWMGRERQRKQAAVKSFVGEVGKRETFILTVNQIKWIRDNYSYDNEKPLIIMSDAEGNEVKWFASNLPHLMDRHYADGQYLDADGTIYGMDVPVIGGTYQVKATVKKHDDHERFGKSSMITRAKFEKTINEPEDNA